MRYAPQIAPIAILGTSGASTNGRTHGTLVKPLQIKTKGKGAYCHAFPPFNNPIYNYIAQKQKIPILEDFSPCPVRNI